MTIPETATRFGPLGPVLVTTQQSHGWIEKATSLAAPLVELAGPVGDPAAVAPLCTHDPGDWAYGNFMLAWLDPSEEVRRVRHLPDASFFLRLLGKAYAPVLERRPELAELLLDESRPEMSLTNDALQIQLRSAEPGPAYSMIRNHALMLFIAALWLDEPQRTGWLDLYDELVSYVDERPGGRPDLTALAECEAGAFADFTALASQTLDPTTADSLLDDDAALARILDYQLYAAAAIGLLWREFRSVPENEREQWYRRQLSELYVHLDYLNDTWTDLS
ncbi:hypothetical protein [Nocardioides sp. 616]|uniref:hypothetical protein n=1 Tax=Nocardioides sp. 616 TaxID=2268090 RepID=UPI0013B3F4B1|nr:hypothetical protein [Nocardioides sp. 616]